MSAYTIGASPAVFRSCPVHSHESWELVINTQGSGTAEINGKKVCLSAGNAHVHSAAASAQQICRRGLL